MAGQPGKATIRPYSPASRPCLAIRFSVHSLTLCVRMKTLPYFLLAVLCLLASCNKDKEPVPALDVIVDDSPNGTPAFIDVTEQLFPLDLVEGQEEFNWESLDFVPSPAGQVQVPMPWNPIAKVAFSNDIADDYHKANGWTLYYSTFSSAFRQATILFALYNRYTGIIRLYFYNFNDFDEIVGEYSLFINTIFSGGPYANESHLLNFADQRIVDLDAMSDLGITFEASPLAANTWYAFEYEIAYDKNLYAKTNDDINIGFNYGMGRASNPEIFGKLANVVSTKFTIADAGYTYGESYDGPVSLIVQGSQDLNALNNPLSERDYESLDQAFQYNDYDAVLNGIVSSDKNGNIKWPARAKVFLNPTSLGLGGVSFSVSGADNSQIQGLGVFYNRAPGVFYLARKPEVTSQLRLDHSHPYVYSLNAASVEYVLNPAVLEIADITNFKQELVGTETDLLEKDYTQAADLYTGQTLASNKKLFIQGVRVSFNVQPKNSQKTFHIIKTFRAQLIEE